MLHQWGGNDSSVVLNFLPQAQVHHESQRHKEKYDAKARKRRVCELIQASCKHVPSDKYVLRHVPPSLIAEQNKTRSRTHTALDIAMFRQLDKRA
jgi:hypothetical protein